MKNYSKNMLYYALIVFIATFGLFTDGKFKLPFTTCKRDLADYSDCLKRAVEEAWPLLYTKGLPELDFPPLEPLFFKHATAKFNLAQIQGEITATNLTIIGLSKIRFHDIKPYFLDDAFRLEINIELPWLYIGGVLKMNGTVNVFRVFGEGYFNETLNDVRTTVDLSGPIVTDTWIVKHSRIMPSIGNLKIYFDILTESQGKEFNNLIVNLVNEFWPSFYRVLLPIIADIYDPWLNGYANKIFSKVPFSEIFP